MSKADKMFEKLGLEKEETEHGCVYADNLNINVIEFDYKDESIYFSESWFAVDELQAINEKCKELGWIE